MKNGYSQMAATSAVISIQAVPDEEIFELPEIFDAEPSPKSISPSN